MGISEGDSDPVYGIGDGEPEEEYQHGNILFRSGSLLGDVRLYKIPVCFRERFENYRPTRHLLEEDDKRECCYTTLTVYVWGEFLFFKQVVI